MTREQMINAILQAAKTSGIYLSGDLFFSLAFKSKNQLIKICNQLYIKVKL
jgi:hypothetical protein